jgi:hypothetical protein
LVGVGVGVGVGVQPSVKTTAKAAGDEDTGAAAGGHVEHTLLTSHNGVLQFGTRGGRG